MSSEKVVLDPKRVLTFRHKRERARERGILALCVLVVTMSEICYSITRQYEDRSWNVNSGIFLCTLSMGVMLGYLFAVKFEKVRSKASRRSVGTQSQCTYKRSELAPSAVAKPHFHVLPVGAEGVFM